MLRALALLLTILLFSGSASAQEQLTAVTDATWPPMEMRGEGRTVVGYDIDILEAIAAEVGLSVKFTNMAWSGIFEALETRHADIIASCVTITDVRKEDFLFSDPYYEVRQAVVVPKNSTISTTEDLKNKIVGIQIGTTALTTIKKMNVPLELRTYDDMGQCFEDLRDGRLNAIVCDDPVAGYYTARKKGYENTMKVAFLSTEAEPVGFVFRKTSKDLRDKINQGLAAIRKNGKEKAIRVKWLGE